MRLFPGVDYRGQIKNLVNLHDTQTIINALPKPSEGIKLLKLDKNSLGNKSAEDIEQIFSRIDESVTILELSFNKLGESTSEHIARAIKRIPFTVVSIDLSNNDLALLDLRLIFSSFHNGLKSLDLSCNKIGDKTEEELEEAFRLLPNSLTSVELSRNNLRAEHIRALRALPSSVTKLDLSSNKFMPGAALADALRALPNSLRELSLSDNFFGRHSRTDAENVSAVMSHQNRPISVVAETISALPSSITSLDLSFNSLARLRAGELKDVIIALPPSIISLNLSCNTLCYLPVDELADAISSLPPSVTFLNLSNNDLGSLSGAKLEVLFRSTPATVTSISLSGNRLAIRTGEELARAFMVVSPNVTWFDLSDNELGYKISNELEFIPDLNGDVRHYMTIREDLPLIFRNLPAGVSFCNFSENQIGVLSREKLAEAFALFPRTLTSVDFSNNEFNDKTSNDSYRFLKIMPQSIKKINFDDNRLFYGDVDFRRPADLFRTQDNRLNIINQIHPQLFMSLRNNGYSELSRVFAPLVSKYRKLFEPSSFHVVQSILSFIIGQCHEGIEGFRKYTSEGITGMRAHKQPTRRLPGSVAGGGAAAYGEERDLGRTNRTNATCSLGCTIQ